MWKTRVVRVVRASKVVSAAAATTVFSVDAGATAVVDPRSNSVAPDSASTTSPTGLPSAGLASGRASLALTAAGSATRTVGSRAGKGAAAGRGAGAMFGLSTGGTER